MSFVPVFVPPPPSARARGLGRQLVETIENFRRQHPGTSTTDVQQALRLAESEVGTNRTLILAVVVGLLVLLGGVALFLYRSDESRSLSTMVPIAILIIGGIAVAAAKMRQ